MMKPQPEPHLLFRPLALAIALPVAACSGGSASSDADATSADEALTIGPVIVPAIPPGISPDVSIDDVVAIQPGWVRVTLKWQRASGTNLAFDVEPTCGAYPLDGPLLRSTALIDEKKNRAVVDLKADLAALAANAIRHPCTVTALTAVMRRGTTKIAQSTLAKSFAMDVPLSHLSPYRFDAPIAADSVKLETRPSYRRWAAYPPQLVAVRSVSGRVAFIEVEELGTRGTLSLRRLAGFDPVPVVAPNPPRWNLAFELHGGGEVPSAWGIDVDGRGISRPAAPVESSHPGVEVFAGGKWTPASVTDPSKFVLPAPPRTSEAVYLANVLDNRGVPRSPRPKDALDVQYDAATHTLNAINGAKVALVEDPPIDHVPLGRIVGATIAPKTGTVLGDLTLTSTTTDFGTIAAGGPGKLAARSWSIPPLAPALEGSVAELAPLPPPVQRSTSPDELRALGSSLASSTSIAGGTCLNTEPHDGFAAPDRCLGLTKNGCPTKADPLRPQTLPHAPGSATDVSLDDILTPQSAGRVNVYGTCGLHSQVQHYEAVYNKLLDDLGPRRVVDVDGLAVTIPEPRVALSPAAFLSNLQTWLGTAPDSTDPSVPDVGMEPPEAAQLPQFAEAYWPARETTFFDWTTSNGSILLARCRTEFWFAGFCSGQGSAPVGAYRSYSTMVTTVGADPVRDGQWSLVNSYMPIKTTTIPLTDRDAAIQAVIGELRSGLPVRLGFNSEFETKPGTPYGLDFLQDDMTFWLPPNLAGCDLDQLYNRKGGHFVNIVGMHIVGPETAPDPFQSLFILQNNWGPNRGYRGYHMMTFAAFKASVNDLITYRLRRACDSVACGGL